MPTAFARPGAKSCWLPGASGPRCNSSNRTQTLVNVATRAHDGRVVRLREPTPLVLPQQTTEGQPRDGA
eukprot:679263-Lingulodinium_polyedra.AAC.1